jgi:hypothetical protein
LRGDDDLVWFDSPELFRSSHASPKTWLSIAKLASAFSPVLNDEYSEAVVASVQCLEHQCAEVQLGNLGVAEVLMRLSFGATNSPVSARITNWQL